MMIVTEQTVTNEYVRWVNWYADSNNIGHEQMKEKAAKIAALGENPDPDEVIRIMGGSSYEKTIPPKCDGCKGRPTELACFRESNVRSTYICLECLDKGRDELRAAIARAREQDRARGKLIAVSRGGTVTPPRRKRTATASPPL